MFVLRKMCTGGHNSDVSGNRSLQYLFSHHIELQKRKGVCVWGDLEVPMALKIFRPTKNVTISSLMHHLFMSLFDFAGHGSKTCLKGHVH